MHIKSSFRIGLWFPESELDSHLYYSVLWILCWTLGVFESKSLRNTDLKPSIIYYLGSGCIFHLDIDVFFFSLFVSANLVMPTSQMCCATRTLSWAAWTRWRGAARILSPTAAASTQMLPNDWLRGSSIWRASSAVTWHDTWARSERLCVNERTVWKRE